MNRDTDKAFAEMLMVAEPARHIYRSGPYATLWLTAEAFWAREDLVHAHDAVLWKHFRSHGKYQWKAARADWFAVAVDAAGKYAASAFVLDGYEKWLLENVMTDPVQQRRGAASSVLGRLMREAQLARVRWVMLHTDPRKNEGRLPRFFRAFGFCEVGTVSPLPD